MRCRACGCMMEMRPSVFYTARYSCNNDECDVAIIPDRSGVKNRGFILNSSEGNEAWFPPS